MKEREQNRNKIRKKCIRFIAYIYVFFLVLNRKLPVRIKKQLAVSFCSLVFAVAIVFSLVGQREPKIIEQEVTVAEVLPENHNRVVGGQTGASIEMNDSRVYTKGSGKEDRKTGQNRNVVAANRSSSTPEEQTDREEQEEVLSPVQALLQNNGGNKQDETMERCYQYPVELGHDDEQNYDGVQSAADYIKKEVYRIGSKKIKEASPDIISQEVSSGAAVSAVSPEAESGSAVSSVSQEVTKDTDTENVADPVFVFNEEKYFKIQGKDRTIYCANDNKIPVDVARGGEIARTGAEKICYMYGERLTYCIDLSENTRIEVPENFYGQIVANYMDAAGNMSDIWSKYFLIENQAPQIQLSQDTFCTTPYTFWVDIEEAGHIVSGIRDVKCQVDGQSYPIKNLSAVESTLLDEGLEVPTKCEFSIPFKKEGEHSVVVTVTDSAGNTATEKRVVKVSKPELISVLMPEKFTIHIDPQRLTGREQIYSDDIMLKNESNFDVQVTVKKVQVSVKDEVSDTGIRKDCNIYMLAPDTGEKILLKKGENKGVYSYSLKKGIQDETCKIRFVGDTTEGSDKMWKDSDVMIRVDLEFSKKE